MLWSYEIKVKSSGNTYHAICDKRIKVIHDYMSPIRATSSGIYVEGVASIKLRVNGVSFHIDFVKKKVLKIIHIFNVY